MQVTTKRALVVDDKDLIRLILVETLKEQGLHAIEARTGDEAVRLLDKADGFDLVVADTQMPNYLDGIAGGHQVRRWHRDIPIAYATSRSGNMKAAPLGSLGCPALQALWALRCTGRDFPMDASAIQPPALIPSPIAL